MFSLIDHIAAPPKVVVCGYPSSGKDTFIKSVLSKHVGEKKSDPVTYSGFNYVNYKDDYSLYIREEEDLQHAIQISSLEESGSRRDTVFVLFVNAALVKQSTALNAMIRDWIGKLLLDDRKNMRIANDKTSSIFIAVSHLDNPDAASVDEIDSLLNAQFVRKLLCNFGFPNYEKQVDMLIQEMGNAIGARNSTLKEAWRTTKNVRNKLAESAIHTTSWIVQQSSELADTISERLKIDESRLASLALVGLNTEDRDSVFSHMTRKMFTSQNDEITIQVVRDYSGYSFKLCNISPNINASNQTRQLVETSNGIIFVVSDGIPIEEQRKYFNQCLENVESVVPVLYVSVGVELNNDEWMNLSEGRFVCSIEYIHGVIPGFCTYLTQHQNVNTTEKSIIASFVPQLEEKLNATLDWTMSQQKIISEQLNVTMGKVTESVVEYTPQIQETLSNVSESVTEGVKNVSNVVSSYWNSWWGNDNQ